jgi:hypothetical protein
MDDKLLSRILGGLSDRNIKFRDLSKLLGDLGFKERVKGDHHIYYREGVEEIINLQPLKGGMAKPYQVRQVRMMILKYKLHGGDLDV